MTETPSRARPVTGLQGRASRQVQDMGGDGGWASLTVGAFPMGDEVALQSRSRQRQDVGAHGETLAPPEPPSEPPPRRGLSPTLPLPAGLC